MDGIAWRHDRGRVHGRATHRVGALVLVSLAIATNARAAPASAPEPRDKAFTSGLALAVGVGYQMPVLGGQADYYWLPPESPIGLMGYLGAGWWPAPEHDAAKGDPSLGLAAGASAFLGHRHRLVVDVGIGLAAIETTTFGATLVAQDKVYGVTAAPGYEYVARGGFLVRASIGATYLLGDIPSGDLRVTPTFNLAVGAKLF